MKKLCLGAWAPKMLVLAAATTLTLPAVLAQNEASMPAGPPKYIYLSNAVLKPGNSAEFAKLESEEIAALRAAKIPAHYFGMWSITGNSGRVLFTRGMDSLASLQKMHGEIMGNATVGPVMRKDNAAEGQLTTSHYGSIYRYMKDLSFNPPASLEDMRFMQIDLMEVYPGKQQEFEHLAKSFLKEYEAALPDAHWVIFQKMYGEGSGTTYILVIPMKSLADVDAMVASGKTFSDKTGVDLLAMLRAQETSIIKSDETDLYAFGTGISYVPDKWLTDSPDFWGKK